MRKEYILSEEEKRTKRNKIEHNRLIKQQAQLAIYQRQQQPNDLTHANSQVNILLLAISETRLREEKGQKLY